MLRLKTFALVTLVGTVASQVDLGLPCIVCIHGGTPGNPSVVVPGTGQTCQYINDKVSYLLQACLTAQTTANQALCGCPGVVAPAPSPNTKSDTTPGAIIPRLPTPRPSLRHTPSATRRPTKAVPKALSKPPARRNTPAPTLKKRFYTFVSPTNPTPR